MVGMLRIVGMVGVLSTVSMVSIVKYCEHRERLQVIRNDKKKVTDNSSSSSFCFCPFVKKLSGPRESSSHPEKN